MARLGEFETLVLLSILASGSEPYANRIREDLKARARRSVTRGALYRTLDRLRDKGFVDWEMEPSRIPARGGHPMRRLLVTDAGLDAVRESREVLLGFLERAEDALGGPA